MSKITGAILANRSVKDKRRKLDFYPTPPEATHALMKFLRLPICTIWECACGDGAMSNVISDYGYKTISTDIGYTGFGEGGIDFLKEERKCDAIITNPPFKLSQKFIVRAIKQAPVVAMLLKSQYWHAKIRTKLFKDYPPSYVLPLNWRPNFTAGEGGKSPTMDVLWTVWNDGERDTRYRILEKPSK